MPAFFIIWRLNFDEMKRKNIFWVVFLNLLLLFIGLFAMNNFIENVFGVNYDKFLSFFYNIQTTFKKIQNNEQNVEIPSDFKEYTEPYRAKRLPFSKEKLDKFCGEKRISFGEQYKNNSILVFGCSYAYGHGLKKEESFPYYLSKITERPVLNFSMCGFEIIFSYQNFLMYLQDNGYKNIVRNSDYIIYMYMFDHVNRYISIKVFYNYYDDIFMPKGLEKKLIQLPIFRFIFSAYRLQKAFNDYPNSKESERIMKKTIISYFKKIEKFAPKSKKIIIIYDEKISDIYYPADIIYEYEVMTSSIWKEIEEETDIKVLHSKDVTGFLFDKDYKIKEDIADWHPNAKAWQVFTPKFAKEYIK